MKSFFAYAVMFYFFMFVAIAHATTYAPQVDFRDGSFWSDANEEHSYSGSQSGVDLTISAAPSEATLWWDDKDGLGIRFSYENDEVESDEILRISFHDEVTLLAIYISDLFVEDGYAEKGSYRINDGALSVEVHQYNGARQIAAPCTLCQGVGKQRRVHVPGCWFAVEKDRRGAQIDDRVCAGGKGQG